MFLEVGKIVKYLQILLLVLEAACQKDGLSIVTKPLFLEDNMYMELLAPEEVSYTYKLKPAKDFGPILNSTYYNLDLVLTDPDHGCSPISNNYDIEGTVAFMKRGGCSFLSKTIQAEQAGALMAVIMDNEATNYDRMIDMIEDGTERKTNIPSFFMLGKDGYMIVQALKQSGRKSALINIPLNVTGVPFNQMNQPPWTLW